MNTTIYTYIKQIKKELITIYINNYKKPKQWITPTGEYQTVIENILEQTHILIAGCSGSGKSVLINNLIYTALYKSPNNCRFILLDPKRVELRDYMHLPHTMAYADETNDINYLLNQTVDIMEHRYKRMAQQGLKQSTEGDIYVIVDEFGDLMATCKSKVEPPIIRLAQLGRAANIHLILAAQNPSRQTITAGIQVNMTAQIALRCRNKIESRMIIGQNGAEELPQYGFGLYYAPWLMSPVQIQISKIEDAEIKRFVDWWTNQIKRTKRTIFSRSR